MAMADLECAGALEVEAGVVPSPPSSRTRSSSRDSTQSHSFKLVRTGKCLGIAVLFGLAMCSTVTMPHAVGSFFPSLRPIWASQKPSESRTAAGEPSQLRIHETFSTADAPAISSPSAPDVSVASEEVGAMMQEALEQDLAQAWPPVEAEPASTRGFWPWFTGETKARNDLLYKGGSRWARNRAYAAERIRASGMRAAAAEPEAKEGTFWPWFESLTKYKRGSYSEAAARIRAYRAAQVKVVLEDADADQQTMQN